MCMYGKIRRRSQRILINKSGHAINTRENGQKWPKFGLNILEWSFLYQGDIDSECEPEQFQE
jgi:hypothetical protein